GSFGNCRPSVQMTRQRCSNMYSINTWFGVCTIWNGRNSYNTIRGNPVGSPMVDSGSLISETLTLRLPLPGLLRDANCSPSGVNGARAAASSFSCGAPLTPAAPASQIPERSRRGAGPPDGIDLNSSGVRPGEFQTCPSPSDGRASKTVRPTAHTGKVRSMALKRRAHAELQDPWEVLRVRVGRRDKQHPLRDIGTHT